MQTTKFSPCCKKLMQERNFSFLTMNTNRCSCFQVIDREYKTRAVEVSYPLDSQMRSFGADCFQYVILFSFSSFHQIGLDFVELWRVYPKKALKDLLQCNHLLRFIYPAEHSNEKYCRIFTMEQKNNVLYHRDDRTSLHLVNLHSFDNRRNSINVLATGERLVIL